MNKLHFTFGLILFAFVAKAQWDIDNDDIIRPTSAMEDLQIDVKTTITGDEANVTPRLRIKFNTGWGPDIFSETKLDKQQNAVIHRFGNHSSTTENDKIVFRSFGYNPSANKNVLTLKSHGLVGVNTINPLKTFDVNGDSYFRGAVGIGTTTTGSHLLAVEGSIGARKLKVEATAWSDFVFADDYKLKSLQEVKSFVAANNHLPDVPSEKEVLTNGIDVATINATLLQKIEELTLYMIEMNDKYAKMNQEVETLKAENTSLETKN